KLTSNTRYIHSFPTRRSSDLTLDMKTFVQIGNGEQSALPPEEKEELLLSRLAGIPSLIVALSGGADSAYLAWASNRALGERALSDRKSTRLNSSHVAISYAVF